MRQRARHDSLGTVAKKILVIEDDADIRSLLNVRLGNAGYDTAFAWDAVTALTVARKEAPDRDGPPARRRRRRPRRLIGLD